MTSDKPTAKAARCISIRGQTWDKVKAYCDEHGITVAALVDKLALKFLETSNGAGPLFDPGELEVGKRKVK